MRRIDCELHFVALQNNYNRVKLAIELGADVNAKDNEGRTALYYAAAKNNFGVCKMLLDCGADINAKTNSGTTALQQAACYDSLDVACLLVEQGADINIKNNAGYSALGMAMSHGNTRVIEYLRDIKNEKAGKVKPQEIRAQQEKDTAKVIFNNKLLPVCESTFRTSYDLDDRPPFNPIINNLINAARVSIKLKFDKPFLMTHDDIPMDCFRCEMPGSACTSCENKKGE